MAAPISDQMRATDPRAHASVSASAGTGKTFVLTSRVFRLLLGGARPESILCLTFTRAGAANMADRIGSRLASWVRMSNADLVAELESLGEDIGPERRERARQLFARVLDAPGGIKILTIHAFAQSLLAAFPVEAGVAPGLKPLEGRAADELAYRTLADLVSDAERGGDTALIADIERLSERLGEKGAVKYLGICAARSDVVAGLDLGMVESRLRDLLSVHECDVDAFLAEQCADGRFDCDTLRALAEANRGWNTQTGNGNVVAIEQWLDLPPGDRAGRLDALANAFLTGGKLRSRVPKTEGYGEQAQAMADAIVGLIDFQRGCRTITDTIGGLRAGKAYAAAYARAKAAAGVADFNDLITWTRRLLDQQGMADWVRYKLDQRIDHVLVDEAQDTNADQWAIIDALTDEYFSGSSEAGGRWRTFLAVGDFKQAIFGFQGTDPSEFERVRRDYKGRADALIGGDADEGAGALPFHDLSMSRSFRSSQGVLDLVDEVIGVIGHDNMGLPMAPARHEVAPKNRHLSARIELWAPFELPEREDDGTGGDGEEGWIDLRERRYASAIAEEVRALIDSGTVLGSTGEPVRPRDIMVLVRSRRALAALIVARLHMAGVPVAGIDRLRLHDPLAVQDLLAAMRFAVQPLDDLNLACLLVSPLIGWSQDDLLALAWDRKPRRLWERLRERAAAGEQPASAAHETLSALLAMADYSGPAAFLETILSGPMQGRKRLYSRLGLSARDPIEELLSTAMAFERDEAGLLDRFIAWFGRGELEVARDPAQLADEVRVMTAHGAKGLEAPVVIIADAHIEPDLQGAHDDPLMIASDAGSIPLSRMGTSGLPEPLRVLADARKDKDRKEHMRLLYVALTRAIDRLVVGGIKPKRKPMPANSWYSKVEQAMINLGAAEMASALPLGARLVHDVAGEGKGPRRQTAPSAIMPVVAVPEWATRPAPAEERPPRPLAPSALVEDREPAAPPSPAMRDAARRGTLIHSLLERLPTVAPDRRRDVALLWLERSAGLDDRALREDLAGVACAIIADPAHAALFGDGSIGEAPLAATLPDGRVIAGTVDRLVVRDNAVEVIDFKTGRVPADSASIPPSHRAQMGAYADALRVIFPGRSVRAILLYTAGPALYELDA